MIGLISLAIMLLAASGCSAIVSQEDLDKLEAQVDELESQVEDLEDLIDEFIEAGSAETTGEADTGSEDTTKQAEESTSADSGTKDAQSTKDAAAFDEDTVLGMLEITEYTYNSDYNNYVFLGVKNNSSYDLNIYGEMIFKNADGGLVGTSNREIYAFEAGQEVMLDFSSDVVFAGYDYTLSVGEEEYYAPVLSSLVKEVSVTDTKAILAVTNNGEKAAKYVEYIVLFLNGNTVVDYEWGYCTDDDSEIKPGKTNYDEASTRETFDSVLVYLNGRADK